jgi:hypothetical protein
MPIPEPIIVVREMISRLIYIPNPGAGIKVWE